MSDDIILSFNNGDHDVRITYEWYKDGTMRWFRSSAHQSGYIASEQIPAVLEQYKDRCEKELAYTERRYLEEQKEREAYVEDRKQHLIRLSQIISSHTHQAKT